MAAPAQTGGMSLLDTVKNNAATLASPLGAAAPQTPPTGQTGEIQALTATAATGKEQAPSTGTARLSNIGERLATLQSNLQLGQVQKQGLLQSEAQQQQAEAQQQSFQASANLMTQQRVSQQQDAHNKLLGMLQQSQEQMQQLSLQDQRGRAEQMGFLLRLSSDKYITKLQDEATRARLDNAVQMRYQTQRAVFDEEQDMFTQNLQFRNILSQQHRDAVKALADIDLDFAIQVAQTEAKSANISGTWSGVGGLGTAGAQAYEKADAHERSQE